MRVILLICGVVFLGGCASTPSNVDVSTEEAGLPTSNLKPGQCGLFGWSSGDKPEFTFYADEKTARYDGVNGPLELVAQSPFPATEYTDPSGKVVTLRLGEGEVMNGGMRYPSARVVTLTDEGWERFHPVAIVKSCQPR